MLACKLCGLTGDPDQYAKIPYIFVNFQRGGGGGNFPPLDPRMYTTCICTVCELKMRHVESNFCKNVSVRQVTCTEWI